MTKHNIAKPCFNCNRPTHEPTGFCSDECTTEFVVKTSTVYTNYSFFDLPKIGKA